MYLEFKVSRDTKILFGGSTGNRFPNIFHKTEINIGFRFKFFFQYFFFGNITVKYEKLFCDQTW